MTDTEVLNSSFSDIKNIKSEKTKQNSVKSWIRNSAPSFEGSVFSNNQNRYY